MSLAITVFEHVFWFGLGPFVALIALALAYGIIMGAVKLFLGILENKL